MADRKPARKTTKKSAKSTTASNKTSKGFTDDERAAMKARAQELKAEARGKQNRADGEREALAAIAAMKGTDRVMAKRVHAIIKDSAPTLSPKTWYGMPAYAKDDKVVCFFQSAEKFKARYATFGFNDAANLDKGAMWPSCLRPEGVDRHRRGEDRRTREEGSALSRPSPNVADSHDLTRVGGVPSSTESHGRKKAFRPSPRPAWIARQPP